MKDLRFSAAERLYARRFLRCKDPLSRPAPSILAGMLAMAFAVAIPAPVHAQVPAENTDETDSKPDDFIVLSDFVVNAQKVARPAREVPMAINAVSGGNLDDLKLFDAMDLPKIAPGLDINTGSARNTIPSIRGVTFNPDGGAASAVDAYWNEMAVGPRVGFRSLYDIQQVEVLKGPQGTLRGRSSPGGAILINTRKPDYNAWGASVVQNISDNDLINTQVAVNAPLLRGKLALRVAGLYDANDGNAVHNITRDEDDRSITRSFRVSLGWKPTENLELVLVHQYLKQVATILAQMEGSPVFDTAGPGYISPFVRIAVSPDPYRLVDRQNLTTLTTTLQLPGDHEFTGIVGLQDLRLVSTAGVTNLANIIPGYNDLQILDFPGKRQTYEVRFASIQHEKWNYILGGYYERSPDTPGLVHQDNTVRFWFEGGRPVQVSSNPTPVAPAFGVPLDLTVSGTSSYRGVFTTQTVQLSEKLRFEAGIRYQEVKSNAQISAPAFGINYQTVVDASATTGSASLSYLFSDAVIGYATLGRSFRPPGQLPRTNTAAFEKYYQFDSETSDSVELGLKGTWFGNRLQVNSALFYQKFDGFLGYAGVQADTNFDGVADNGIGITFNADAEVKGVELGVTASLPHRVVVGVDATYSIAEYSGGMYPANVLDDDGDYVFNTPGEQVSFLPAAGRRIGDTPELYVSATAGWSKPIGSNEFFARGLLRYRGSRELLNVPDPHLGGYGIADVFVGLRSGDHTWSVTLWAKNLLDREVVTWRNIETNIGNWYAGYTAVRVERARELGASFSYRF